MYNNIVLIGGGIMSATLSVILKELFPNAEITIIEKLHEIALESSNVINNAGTGHSGYCELNYTYFDYKHNIINIDRAINIAKKFQLSKEFWAFLIRKGYIDNISNIINNTPHISLVFDDENINFLYNRYNKLKNNVYFKNIIFSKNIEQIYDWVPLIIEGRNKKNKIAITKINNGTDVNFGEIAKQIIKKLNNKKQIQLLLNTEVKDINKVNNKWKLILKNKLTNKYIEKEYDFVFIGCGGNSLNLFHKTKLKESYKYAGFPVGGQWLICNNTNINSRHNSKVYGKADKGTPPMSVPHLDTRYIHNEKKLIFGPFATFSTKFTKNGSYLDLFKSLNYKNINFLINCGINNINLTKYLIKQLLMDKKNKINHLKKYYPNANISDWDLTKAGQRVQIIKKQKNKGILKFGTEVVISQDKSLAVLLGASPGASTSYFEMLQIVLKCFKNCDRKILLEISPSLYENNEYNIEKNISNIDTQLNIN